MGILASQVPADAKGVVKTLRSVYDRCAVVAQGPKKRELDDTSRRLGTLFWRLANDDISPGVKASLRELCAALDARDFPTALQKQVCPLMSILCLRLACCFGCPLRISPGGFGN